MGSCRNRGRICSFMLPYGMWMPQAQLCPPRSCWRCSPSCAATPCSCQQQPALACQPPAAVLCRQQQTMVWGQSKLCTLLLSGGSRKSSSGHGW
jgi:hypothetical protein